jgi:hypothetical protein
MSHAAAPIKSTGLPTAADVKIAELDNNSLVVQLHFTINHLSRWLTPIHDRRRLERSVFRGQPSVKELLIQLRDEELRVFPKLHLMSIQINPNLDKLPEYVRSARQDALDAGRTPLGILAEFRRLRQSTCSLLRTLPDSGWTRTGVSRREHDWQIRSLAEHLANRDIAILAQMDEVLDRNGARDDVSPAAKAHLDELLRLVPVNRRAS